MGWPGAISEQHARIARDRAALPERVRLSRAAGSHRPAGTVTADRGSILGNPWLPGTPGRLAIPINGRTAFAGRVDFDRPLTSAEVVAAHARWLREGAPMLDGLGTSDGAGMGHILDMLDLRRRQVLDVLSTLRGRPIGCWCAPDAPCHAHTLLEIANG